VATFDFSIPGGQVERALRGTFGKPLRPLYAAIAEYLYARTMESFDAQTAPDGQRWAELTPAYAKRKAKAKSRNKILQRTGQLRETIAATATNDAARLVSNRPVGRYSLAAIHQYGAPRAGIPARPFMPIDARGELLPSELAEIEALIRDYFAL